ncbi:UDP-glucose 4-epimerase GalE [Microterricola viridarii]|uniref:UDP-glucose 4-epimerase n=1 Tax=Microterricola viridarii TaxID=412690 RepID=A0A120HZU6_9MICO|nr:UDP-glucose 4-epimerase GalE [Microterricola viridarii]AMB57842.1 UDP-glucose 4-epimerase [Microterricola viridarii]
MRTLITGGAGYIGAHIVRLLRERGDDVVIVDDLATGSRSRVADVPVHVLDLTADGAVDSLVTVMREHRVEAVVHLAARKRVDESVRRPAWYFAQNIGGLAAVLEAMQQAGVGKLLFSSSAAVYGATEGDAIGEDSETSPINPYGETKLVGEHLVTAAAAAFELRAVSLRYFNVAGTGWPELRDHAALNLIPMVFERLEAGLPPQIFGTDYPTTDGTCVRDYVHVLDVADAHLVALDSLGAQERGHEIYNIGTGHGTSVREIVQLICDVAGYSGPVLECPRREGDPASVVASAQLIGSRLGWHGRHDIREMVESAWNAQHSAP